MLKLSKYLKPFLVSILMILGLLFIQAQADLALPEYMAKIVDTGISRKGIESSVLEAISEQTVNDMKLVLSNEEYETIMKKYQKIEKDDSKYMDTYPILSTSSIYVLTDHQYDESYETLMGKALMFVSVINSDQLPPSQELTDIKNLYNVSTLKELLVMMDETTRKTFIDQVVGQFESLDASTIKNASYMLVTTEYDKIGLKLEGVQMKYIFNVGIQMLGITLIGVLAMIAGGYLGARVAAKFSMNMRKTVFEKITDFSNAEFEKFSTSSLITRTTNDIQQLQMFIIMMFRIIFFAPMLGIGGLLKVLGTQNDLAWIIALALGAILILIFIVFNVALPKFKIIQTLVDRLNLVTREALSGMLVIRAFSNQKVEEEKFEKANADLNKTNLFVNRTMVVLMPTMTFIMNLVAIMIVWFGAQYVDLGTLQIGDMMAFMQYSMQIIMSFLMISMVFIMIPRATVSANRVHEILETQNSILDPKQEQPFDESKKGIVEFKNVSFKYPNATEYVLHNVSFTAYPNQTTAFIGSTGSGKSTLINLVPRFFDVSDGAILIDNVDIRNVSQAKLREKIGYVEQKSLLFSGTIRSNINYSNDELSEQETLEAARISQALEFIEQKTAHLEEPIAQGGSNVSGGQKQRLSIARALAKKPEILIFDDSFSALDFNTDKALRSALAKEIKDTTILLVAQRIGTIKNADQIVVLDEGKVVGIGKHNELMKTCQVYQEIANSQLSKEELDNE